MCLAVPGRIKTIEIEDPVLRAGKVDFGGVARDVNLAYVPEAGVGDYVIVHVGFAISRLDEEEAHQVFRYLKEMDDLAELEDNTAPPDADTPPRNRAVGAGAMASEGPE